VLADEPTGNLDGRTAEDMHLLMEQLNAETGTAFVVVSHNQELAGRMRRLVRMQDGVIHDDSVAPAAASPTDADAGQAPAAGSELGALPEAQA
jgi:ABC-type lipoprotein export system ATPase subunit